MPFILILPSLLFIVERQMLHMLKSGHQVMIALYCLMALICSLTKPILTPGGILWQ